MRTLLRFLVWTTLIVGIVVGIARATVIKWHRMPTNDPYFEASISPTLRGGDLILTWRGTEPRFGDLVLCPEPDFPERMVIGRIYGLPGDDVTIDKGEVFVNGERFHSERGCDPNLFEVVDPNDDSEIVKQQCSWEAIGTNQVHMKGEIGAHKVPPEKVSFDVPEGVFFLVSDNRLYPYDSRDFGFVPQESCKETVIGRLVSKKGWMDSPNRLNYIQ